MALLRHLHYKNFQRWSQQSRSVQSLFLHIAFFIGVVFVAVGYVLKVLTEILKIGYDERPTACASPAPRSAAERRQGQARVGRNHIYRI
ncbi:MAG: hypothetical protein QXS54_11905 [Candidatus Methanomethylicaceae archaeon]